MKTWKAWEAFAKFVPTIVKLLGECGVPKGQAVRLANVIHSGTWYPYSKPDFCISRISDLVDIPDSVYSKLDNMGPVGMGAVEKLKLLIMEKKAATVKTECTISGIQAMEIQSHGFDNLAAGAEYFIELGLRHAASLEKLTGEATPIPS